MAESESWLVADLGCGVGASSLALADSGARVMAVDFDFAALRVLARLVRSGEATVPVWGHGGADYGSTRIRLREGQDASAILPIAADALAPPFAADTFDLVTCYHLIDNVPEPVVLLRQMAAILRPNGRLHLASPYDWVARCTPRAQQLGAGIGGTGERDPAVVMQHLLEGRMPELAPGLRFRIDHQVHDLPWIIRRHARSYHVFLCHYVEAVADG